jgi:hypothetical protein
MCVLVWCVVCGWAAGAGVGQGGEGGEVRWLRGRGVCEEHGVGSGNKHVGPIVGREVFVSAAQVESRTALAWKKQGS